MKIRAPAKTDNPTTISRSNADAMATMPSSPLGPVVANSPRSTQFKAIVQRIDSSPRMAAQRRALPVNDNAGLEQEADAMGAQAARWPGSSAQVQLTPAPAEGAQGVAQFKGPRNYASTFKGKKDEMMTWLKDSQLIGMDLSPDDVTTDEENAKIGWHHQYPYSHLWDNHNKHALADHGSNLKLGPMKNRIGDPGHEIDLSYRKARKTGTGRGDIAPQFSPLSEKLFTELRERPKRGTHSSGPSTDIDLRKIKTDGLSEDVYDSKDDKEEYWSEWYLSQNIRSLLLSDTLVGQALTGMNKTEITSAKSTIIATLNRKLDSMCYSYATHTPALEDGKLGPFQTDAIVETGIPSSKLNRSGPLADKLVPEHATTYADLVHGMLLKQDWITRGSQGEAHSLAEQFKDKMRNGNDTLIVNLLKDDALAELKKAVIAKFKVDLIASLPKLDNIADYQEELYVALEAKQQTARIASLEKTAVVEVFNDIIEDFSFTRKESTEVAPTESADSFVPDYPNKKGDIKKVTEAFEAFGSGEDYSAPVGEIINTLIRLNGTDLDIDEAGEDIKYIYDWQGELTISEDDLLACISPMLPAPEPETTSKRGGKSSKSPSPSKLHAEKVAKFVKAIAAALAEANNEYSGYWQQTVSVEKSVTKDMPVDDAYNQFDNKYKSKGKDYMRHHAAINNKDAHAKYAKGIERALRAPGKGYTDPSLTYPLPDEIRSAKSDATWDFGSDIEARFKADWHRAEFSEFLKAFIAKAEVQETLVNDVPAD